MRYWSFNVPLLFRMAKLGRDLILGTFIPDGLGRVEAQLIALVGLDCSTKPRGAGGNGSGFPRVDVSSWLWQFCCNVSPRS